MHQQRDLALRHRRRLLAAEHLLQLDRQHRGILAVVDSNDRARRHRHPLGRQPLQVKGQRPGQAPEQDRLQVQLLEVLQPAHLPEVGQ